MSDEEGKVEAQGKQAAEQSESTSERDAQGHFLPGNTVGAGHGWKPGQSGNPNGRPIFTTEIRRVAKVNKGKKLRKLVQSLFDQAHRGNVQAAKIILDRVDGPVVQRSEVEVSGKLGYEDRLAQLEAMRDELQTLPAPDPVDPDSG